MPEYFVTICASAGAANASAATSRPAKILMACPPSTFLVVAGRLRSGRRTFNRGRRIPIGHRGAAGATAASGWLLRRSASAIDLDDDGVVEEPSSMAVATTGSPNTSFDK